MICSRCGTENRAEVRFCRHCGQKLVADQPQTPPAELTAIKTAQPISVCQVCGTAVKSTARFCPRCGKELRVSPPLPVPQQPLIPAHVPESVTITNQLPKSETPGPPTYQAPAQKPSYSQPMEPPPPSVKDQYTKKDRVSTGGIKAKGKAQSSSPKWIWGAVIGIVILVVILIVLSTIFIPKALKGTGLFTTNTATAVTVEEPSVTLTHTPSSSPTVELTTTPEPTVEAPPVTAISAASIILTTAPETITVNSHIVVTVSLTNDSEALILPLRCDLVGSFAPVLRPAEGITYTLKRLDTEPALVPGATAAFVYRFDVLAAGTATIGADILIEVNSPDYRQVIIAPTVSIMVQ